MDKADSPEDDSPYDIRVSVAHSRPDDDRADDDRADGDLADGDLADGDLADGDLADSDLADIDLAKVALAIRRTLKSHRRDRCTLSVALVDDCAMSELHQRYMSLSGPTDVLAFDLGEEDTQHVDGEIVICVDEAIRQSRARGHSVAKEVLLYAVHGTLHLLGYDDQTEPDARRMHAQEDAILTELGVGLVYGVPPG